MYGKSHFSFLLARAAERSVRPYSIPANCLRSCIAIQFFISSHSDLTVPPTLCQKKSLLWGWDREGPLDFEPARTNLDLGIVLMELWAKIEGKMLMNTSGYNFSLEPFSSLKLLQNLLFCFTPSFPCHGLDRAFNWSKKQRISQTIRLLTTSSRCWTGPRTMPKDSEEHTLHFMITSVNRAELQIGAVKRSNGPS